MLNISEREEFKLAHATVEEIESEIETSIARVNELTQSLALSPPPPNNVAERAVIAARGGAIPVSGFARTQLELQELNARIEVMRRGLPAAHDKLGLTRERLGRMAAEEVKDKHRVIGDKIIKAIRTLQQAATDEEALSRELVQAGYGIDALPRFAGFFTADMLNWHAKWVEAYLGNTILERTQRQKEEMESDHSEAANEMAHKRRASELQRRLGA